MAQADLGIAIGAGSDVAVETADVILVRSNPMDVVALLKLSQATHRKMIQNLVWATGYNVVAIPLAAGVLYTWGVVLTPAVGAALMGASTVIVAINARLLRLKTRPRPETKDKSGTITNIATEPGAINEQKVVTKVEPEPKTKAKKSPEVKSVAKKSPEMKAATKTEIKAGTGTKAKARTKIPANKRSSNKKRDHLSPGNRK